MYLVQSTAFSILFPPSIPRWVHVSYSCHGQLSSAFVITGLQCSAAPHRLLQATQRQCQRYTTCIDKVTASLSTLHRTPSVTPRYSTISFIRSFCPHKCQKTFVWSKYYTGRRAAMIQNCVFFEARKSQLGRYAYSRYHLILVPSGMYIEQISLEFPIPPPEVYRVNLLLLSVSSCLDWIALSKTRYRVRTCSGMATCKDLTQPSVLGETVGRCDSVVDCCYIVL